MPQHDEIGKIIRQGEHSPKVGQTLRRFAQTQIRTKHTPNLRSFLLEHSCKDDPLIVSPNLIKSPIQSTVYHFTKGKDLDLDKKIEGLA